MKLCVPIIPTLPLKAASTASCYQNIPAKAPIGRPCSQPYRIHECSPLIDERTHYGKEAFHEMSW